MAALAKQVVAVAGNPVVPVAAAAGGDTIACEPGTFLLAQNTTGAPINITAVTPGTEQGLAVADLVIAVPANGFATAGPFNDLFANASDGQCHLTYSTNVGLTVAAVHLPS